MEAEERPPPNLGSNTTSAEPDEELTPQQHARIILQHLEELIGSIDHARTNPSTMLKPPSELTMALISDAMSLIEGISTNAIRIGQPRIVKQLIGAVAELESHSQHMLAAAVTDVIRVASTTGIAAENCALDRTRHRIKPQSIEV